MQEIALLRPYLAQRLILAGTGPMGGRSLFPWSDEVRVHACKDVPGAEDLFFLFFAPTETSQAREKEFVQRIFRRQLNRDETPSLMARDAQVDAISEWGHPDMGQLARLERITQPTLVANGNADVMVPTVNSYLLAGHIPNAELIIYPDAGHGFLFQYPHEFAAEVNGFLSARARMRAGAGV